MRENNQLLTQDVVLDEEVPTTASYIGDSTNNKCDSWIEGEEVGQEN